MPTFELIDFERVVLGTAGLAGLWGKVDPMESVETILMALKRGIKYVDTAPAYADAQSILALALKQWKGTPPFISTKAGKLRSDSAEIAHYDYSTEAISRSVQESIDILGLEALDLLFLHDPTSMKIDEIPSALACMVDLKEKGLVKNIGIGGNFGAVFEGHVRSGIFSHFMGYNRYNLLKQTAAEQEYKLVRSERIEVWQASPLYMGLLGNKLKQYTTERPDWIPADDLYKASVLKEEWNAVGCDLTGLALNYVYHSSCVDKMVIGACNSKELEATFGYLENEALRNNARELLRKHGWC